MKIKFSILFALFFMPRIMSCNKIKCQEFLAPDFTQVYIEHHPEVLGINSLVIRNPNWTVYPPNGEMPINALYYSIPKFIKDFKYLQTLNLSGVFVSDLPEQLIVLTQLKYLAFALGTKSNIEGICIILKEMPRLKTLNLSGSIISDAIFNKIKLILPDVHVVDVVRSMEDKMGKH